LVPHHTQWAKHKPDDFRIQSVPGQDERGAPNFAKEETF
jgi:hypothetical protein